MTVNSNNDELNGDLPDDIAALLSNERTWSPVDDDLETSVVAAVLAEAESPGEANVATMPSRWKTAAMGAAAALLLVAAVFGVAQLTGDNPDVELALSGTDFAPEASAIVEITDTPQGTRIIIEVSDLPPAAPGTYYEAWLRKDAAIGVSAGTFHLRRGDGPIELWAGVSADDYPLVTVSLQQEAQTEPSGVVVLKGLIDQP